MWWGSVRIDRSKFYLVQKDTFVLGISYSSISGNFYLVGCSPRLLRCRFPIEVLINFSVCLFINCSVRPDQVLRKSSSIALMMIAVVRLKSVSCIYCDSSGLVAWSSMVFATYTCCCVSRGNSHIPIFLFLVNFIIFGPFFLTEIYCLSSVMVHPSSHKNPNDISGAI